jgi:hypothetical protein
MLGNASVELGKVEGDAGISVAVLKLREFAGAVQALMPQVISDQPATSTP